MITDSFKSIMANRDSAINDILDKANDRFTELLNLQVDSWNRRFKRHKIVAWEGHGMLSIEINPPLPSIHTWGMCDLAYANPTNTRGCVKELVEQAQYISSIYHDSDFNISLVYQGEET